MTYIVMSIDNHNKILKKTTVEAESYEEALHIEWELNWKTNEKNDRADTVNTDRGCTGDQWAIINYSDNCNCKNN